ncbi:MAG: peptidoglycan-binding protein LysM [Nonlabens sp.]|uniref:peptidoglycan-binding protein LysM n=1 Tax=Nonlabens sp. TaxID=1888209 RepID=UPI003EF70D06
MKSRHVFLVGLPLVLIFWSFSNNHLKLDTSSLYTSATAVNKEFYDATAFVGPVLNSTYFDVRYYSLAITPPDSFLTFREALAFKESQGKFWKVNSLGYMGKYQFGMSTLETLGVTDSLRFLRSPRLQERVFIKNLRYNHEILEPYILKYAGKKVGGVYITESGILAAAHLSGPGGVKRFFKTKGRKSNRDAYGSSVKTYMKRFAGYDMSEVIEP